MGFFKSTRVFICRHQLSHRQALPLLGPKLMWEAWGKAQTQTGELLLPLDHLPFVCAFDFQAVTELFRGHLRHAFCCCFPVFVFPL